MMIDFSNIINLKAEVIESLYQTLLMVTISTSVSVILGGVLGILLFVTRKGQILANQYLYQILSQLVNFIRSFPFVILMVALLGVTKLIIGSSIGPLAASFVLSIAGVFFFSRLVEQNLREVPQDVLEAAEVLGASYTTIIFKVLIAEALPGLILSITILVISLLSYSAAAGMIGGGGLGDLAIRYGYNRYQTDVIIFIVAILAIMVVTVQSIGNLLTNLFDKR